MKKRKIVKKLSRWIIALSSVGIVSCSQNSSTPTQKLGSIDQSVKGIIAEDLPTFTAREMEQEFLKNSNLSKTLKWQHLDLDLDGAFGVSADRIYSELNLKQDKTIIVAVIDSGVDTKHEDLKNMLWVNKMEIPNNGIDDDQNGYVDDIHGWNFLGGKNGKNLEADTLEETRIYRRILDKKAAGIKLTKREIEDFLAAKKLVDEGLEKHLPLYQEALVAKKNLGKYRKILKEKYAIDEVNYVADIVAIPETNAELIDIKFELLKIWNTYSKGDAGIDKVIERSGYYVQIGYNISYDGREKIVGDNPSDFTDKGYGNNDVKGPRSRHGTHVSGIIGAERNNNLGMDGIATNVEIMALRAVPNGDERDKDIALAVRYAADNGAHIINMSFGKKFSPYKEEVDAAFAYAASKGVIFFHSAGNSSLNNNGGEVSFPNSYKRAGFGVLAVNTVPNWVEVGASSRLLDESLVARFSNYGKESVTLFAPGHKIYSTTPENTYKALSGTSMAAPVAAGVAAMLMSEYKDLEGEQILEILKESVSLTDDLNVELPGGEDEELIEFSELSQTGGIINLYNAFKKAADFNR